MSKPPKRAGNSASNEYPVKSDMQKSLMRQAVPRKEGIEELPSAQRYHRTNLPLSADMLHGVTVRSQVPRGRIRNISFEGDIPWHEFVIVTAKDIPAANAVALILDDQLYLATDGVVNLHPRRPSSS